jgi:uncharacterized protein YjbI with pentapeptide repeats
MEESAQTSTGTAVEQPVRPAGTSRAAWRTYWRARGQRWRTEPEIEEPRQQELAARRTVVFSIARGVYPFREHALSRADIEWLLATHDGGRGPVNWDDETQRERVGLDLRGADLHGVDLRRLPLARTVGGMVGGTDEQAEQAAVHLENAELGEADLRGAYLQQAVMTGAKLQGASLEGALLTATRLNRANLQGVHLEGANLRQAYVEKADLTGAHLEGAVLSGAHMAVAILTGAHLEGSVLGGARLKGAFLQRAHLEGARVFGAHLEQTTLSDAHLEGTMLRRVHLEGASLANAHFEGVRLSSEDLARIRRWRPDLPEQLPPADLRLAFFDAATTLQGATLAADSLACVSLADVRWGDVNLAVLRWTSGRNRPLILGDETEARVRRDSEGKRLPPSERLAAYEGAVRANRQLALVLQAQGLNEDAARFAYRAQVLQRVVLRRQRRIGQWLFSHFLDALAGYGYKPGRSVLAYLCVIVSFAVVYFELGQAVGPHLSFIGALTFSITSFHGRGFFPGGVSLDDPITQVAAVEAVLGLLIEISFIATFTQRFFGTR